MVFTPFTPTIGGVVPPLPVSQGGTGLAASPITIPLGGTSQTTDPLMPAMASDHGLLAWNYDWAAATNTNATTAGTLYLMRVNIRVSFTWTNVWFAVQAAGSGASTGSFVGLYSSAGSLLSGSADIAASLTATGVKSVALTTPQSVSTGTFVWVAFLANLATTQPTLQRSTNNVNVPNVGLSAALARFTTNGTGLTSLPASITPSSNSLVSTSTFCVAGN